MLYLVDGYNVAHRLFGVAGRRASAEQLRDAVLRRIRPFCSRRRRVIVVFDGDPDGRPIRGELEIRYARSADDEIVRIVRDHPDPGRLRVVSHDREVTGKSRQLGARIVRVVDFLDDLDDLNGPDIVPGEPPEKYDL